MSAREGLSGLAEGSNYKLELCVGAHVVLQEEGLQVGWGRLLNMG